MTENKHFNLDMTIAEALAVDPRVAQVFAAFHLGGCALCHMGQVETLGQVCEGYGIDADQLLEVLERLMADQPSETPSTT